MTWFYANLHELRIIVPITSHGGVLLFVFLFGKNIISRLGRTVQLDSRGIFEVTSSPDRTIARSSETAACQCVNGRMVSVLPDIYSGPHIVVLVFWKQSIRVPAQSDGLQWGLRGRN